MYRGLKDNRIDLTIENNIVNIFKNIILKLFKHISIHLIPIYYIIIIVKL